MRIIKAMTLVLIGASLLVTGCGSPSSGSAPASTPTAKPAGGMDMTMAPAQTTAGTNFTTSGLTVTPANAKPGDRVMVGVTVTNTGSQEGTYTVVAKDHDGTVLGTKVVTLAGGAKEDVSMQISISTTGTHMVMIDKLSKNLVSKQDSATNTTSMPPMQMTPPNQTTSPPVAAATGPANFVLSKLVVPDTMIMPKDDISISVTVANTGGQQGTYHVVMKIHDNQTKKDTEKTQDVTLAGGAQKNVTFPLVAGDPGEFQVAIGNLTGLFTVMGEVVCE